MKFFYLVSFALAVVLTIVSCGSSTPSDMREVYFQEDLGMLSDDPATTNPLDTTASTLSMMFSVFVNEEMNPSAFQYMTKTIAGKTMAIIDVPNLDELDPNEWPEIANMVGQILDVEEGIKDYPRYIGVTSYGDLKVIKAPSGTNFSDFLKFYGPEKIPVTIAAE